MPTPTSGRAKVAQKALMRHSMPISNLASDRPDWGRCWTTLVIEAELNGGGDAGEKGLGRKASIELIECALAYVLTADGKIDCVLDTRDRMMMMMTMTMMIEEQNEEVRNCILSTYLDGGKLAS